MSDRQSIPRRPDGLRVLLAVVRFLLPVLVMAGAVYGSILLIGARPTPPRIDRDQRATLVETVLPVTRPDRAVITGYGTVEAHRVLTLQPQVGGAVLEVNPSLVAGGLVGTGEVLMQIETQDYELALQQRRAEVANAEVDLQMAEASSLVAQREWELLGESIETSDIGRQLARKEPQRREAEAMLDAARGKLKLAELDLERTTIRAPFNALVLNDSVELGQIVAPRTPVATLVGTDEFEVIASIPLAKIPLIVIDPADPARNSRATVTLELGDGRTLVRRARVDRLAGEVERSGRLAKVIIQ
ncbi:MAG: HlyD family efflux transporter periplasmic adaptor subunit, partial [Planctomycetota bacterium]|nr:HlyD family efflux transporter periplasmic adaptor subunit [Planctomycetota bacterium]